LKSKFKGPLLSLIDSSNGIIDDCEFWVFKLIEKIPYFYKLNNFNFTGEYFDVHTLIIHLQPVLTISISFPFRVK